MNIEMERPLIILLLPVIIGLLIFSVRYLYVRRKTAKVMQIIMRALVASALVFVLSGTSISFHNDTVTTIFLLDASDSVKDSQELMCDYVEQALHYTDKKDMVGVVAFGEDARVEQFVSKTPAFYEMQTNVSKTATNLEDAVEVAMTMFPRDSAKRIVLLSDGVENEGDITKTVERVISEKVQFQYYELSKNDSNEVFVTDVSVPQSVAMDEKYNITVKIESNVSCDALVNLYTGRVLKGQQTVKLQKGSNSFIFVDNQEQEGISTYRVTVEAEEDTMSVNNEYSAYTAVSGKKPILVIEGESGDTDEFLRVLDSTSIHYEKVTPGLAPASMEELLKYSAIILVNTYKDDLRNGFVDQVESYVKDYGGGLIATGGRNAFALGNYSESPLEEVLPVYMHLQGEQEVPSTAIEMVIDRSGSMSDGGLINNLEIAKQAAILAIENMRAIDYAGVIAFDDQYQEIVPLGSVENKVYIENCIGTISIGGGTSIYPALEAAARNVLNSDAKIKHIILLTDGQDYYDNYDPLLQTIKDGGVTLSTIAIGTGCNATLLSDLAASCDGRYYYTDSNSDIPQIFAQEVYLSANSYLVNEEFTPELTSNDELITQVASEGFPSLLGYVATSKKERATELLASSGEDPILCCWQYGLGRTVAWMSDVSGNWSGNWSGWVKTPQLWGNLIRYVTQEISSGSSYSEVEQEGNQAVIRYFTDTYDSETKITAKVAADGTTKELELQPVNPGEYEAVLEMPKEGVYSINLQESQNGEVVNAMNTAAVMQYSQEYRFDKKGSVMSEYLASVGGLAVITPDLIFNDDVEAVRGRLNIGIVLLMISLILFMGDIAVRRFHLDPVGALVNSFHPEKKKRKKRQEIGQTDSHIESFAYGKDDGMETSETRSRKEMRKLRKQDESLKKKTGQTELSDHTSMPKNASEQKNEWKKEQKKEKQKEKKEKKEKEKEKVNAPVLDTEMLTKGWKDDSFD